MMCRAVSWAAVFLSVTAPLGAQHASLDSLGVHADRVFARFNQSTPGCAAAVYQDGKVAWAKGYGLANIEYDVPITPATPFILGSVSKQFTAAAIALLVEEGRIKLGDDVRKYIPELPDYGKPITIDHLVHHTSGLRDWWELVALAGMRNDDTYGVSDVFDMTVRQRGLNFAPGDRYLYSNTGYIMLGIVVQRVTGTSLRDFAAARIFGPLGMSQTHFHDDHTVPVKGRAFAYAPANAGEFRINVWNNDLVGQGGVMTNILELQRWEENFYTGAVGGEKFLSRQLERGKLNDGTVLPYAFGLEHGSYRGLPIVEHSGSTGGYRTVITRFPKEHTSFAALCNISNAAPSTLVRRIADYVLRDRLAPAVATTPAAATAAPGTAPRLQAKSVAIPAAALQRLAGKYFSEELSVTYELQTVGGALVLRRPRARADTLAARDSVTFAGSVGTLRFAGGGFTLTAGRVEGVQFVKAK